MHVMFISKHKATSVGALAAVGLTLLACLASLSTAAGTSAGGTVRLYEADTALAGNLGTVILTGAVTDHGKDHQGAGGGGEFNRLVLSKGSFEFNIAQIGNKISSIPTDSKTCSTSGSASGPLPIVNGSGTGAYRRIRGTLHATVTVASIVPRLKSGRCNTVARRYPGVLLATGTGRVTYR